MSKQTDFIAAVVEGARQVQRDVGMFASVTIAQSAWETGWGVSTPKDIDTGEESYNLFGRKASVGEPYVNANTWEVYDGQRVNIVAKFKKFDSYKSSILDRSSFLKLLWYQKACNANNVFDAARFLIDTGYPGYSYATDPNYADSIISIIKSYDLTQYDLPKDRQEEDMDKMLEYDDWAWEELDHYVGDAYNDEIIDSWDWVEKVRNKEITYKDLLLLKILIDERRRTKELE